MSSSTRGASEHLTLTIAGRQHTVPYTPHSNGCLVVRRIHLHGTLRPLVIYPVAWRRPEGPAAVRLVTASRDEWVLEPARAIAATT